LLSSTHPLRTIKIAKINITNFSPFPTLKYIFQYITIKI
jgi:hypothetical protein